MIPAERWLDPLAKWLPVAAAGQDADGVHQVRVASRRLDAWLRLAGMRALRDDLRWLRLELADARDLDVLLEEEVPGDLRAWLAAHRADEQPRVVAAVESERTHALVEALRLLPALDPEVAREGLQRVIGQVQRRGEAIGGGAPDPEALHALRRALRRLRFSLSWLGEDHAALVALQDAFGAYNDRVLLLRWLDRYPREDRHQGWRAEVEAARDRDQRAVIEAWAGSEAELMALGDTWTSS